MQTHSARSHRHPQSEKPSTSFVHTVFVLFPNAHHLYYFRDITEGIEDVAIPLVNHLDDLSPPHYVYVKKNVFPSHIKIRKEMAVCGVEC